MQPLRRSNAFSKISISFGLLVVLLGVLWLAGGASRADAAGQVVVRGAAWLALIAATLAGERPALRRVWPPAIFLGLAVALTLLQLVPLPPSIWLALPGRSTLAEAAAASGQAQPWRPWSIVPAATVNAASSLVVPAAVLVLMATLTERERAWLPGVLLGFVAAAMVVGLLQFSGAGFDNALINDVPGKVGGIFANRNHFALLLAIGCLLAPAWAFLEGRRPGWRGPVALGLVLLFVLAILATGSRAGMAVGALATMLGLLLARRGLRRELRGAPRWVFPAAIAAIIALIVIFVIFSVTANRAESVNRLLGIDAAGDTRVRTLPTVLAMIQAYFPAGTGFGGFDPLFRMNEPDHLLKPTYFNHAHNDFLEIALDGGISALVLLAAALAWWILASIRAWRAGSGTASTLPRAGSAMLALILVASVFDYPARTPMIMAMIVVAAVWLTDPGRLTLPKPGQQL